MYSLGQIAKGLRLSVTNRNLVLRECNRLYHRRLHSHAYNPDGVDVMAEDWETLVILDACRYDVFRDRHSLPGTLTARTSRGSHTSEFIRGNFQHRSFPDTVYVTASPILRRGLGERYHTSFNAIVDVWAEDGWNEEHRTVMPDTMTEYVLGAVEDHPHKRIVAHYVQPHFPFIGSDVFEDVPVPDPAVLESDVWAQLMTGEAAADPERIWQAYRRNLDRVLPAVDRLVDQLGGKVVVTSDHGNMIGERASPIPVREWGHPPGVYTPELVHVPWLEIDAGPGRDIRDGTVASEDEGHGEGVDESVVTDRLRQLGYAE